MYKIKNKLTGLCLVNTRYEWDSRLSTGARVSLGWYPDTPTVYIELKHVNEMVEDIVCNGQGSDLDDCEIHTVEVVYEPIKDTNRLKNIRARIEKQEIIRKLKG